MTRLAHGKAANWGLLEHGALELHAPTAPVRAGEVEENKFIFGLGLCDGGGHVREPFEFFRARRRMRESVTRPINNRFMFIIPLMSTGLPHGSEPAPQRGQRLRIRNTRAYGCRNGLHQRSDSSDNRASGWRRGGGCRGTTAGVVGQ